MRKNSCANSAKFALGADFYECSECGNHVCAEKAKAMHEICPFCFGRLFRIS